MKQRRFLTIIIALVCAGVGYAQQFETFKPVPAELRTPAEKQGKVETFLYTVKIDGKKVTKHARVYVPYGYDKNDKSTRYNVVYLIHGGGDNSTSFFADPRSPLPLTNVLDHLIASGKMKPVLVVTPTFYVDDENIGANRMEDATRQTRDFHLELEKYLIPSVEKAYNTYFKGKGSKAVSASREHRAFGGFSMGSLCTWYQLLYGVNAVSRFIPLSGDLWLFDADGTKKDMTYAAKYLNDQLAATPYANSFKVYAYTGTDDIAYQPETSLIQALCANAPLFHYGENGNLTFSVKTGGKHYYGDINEYLYVALPKLWQ